MLHEASFEFTQEESRRAVWVMWRLNPTAPLMLGLLVLVGLALFAWGVLAGSSQVYAGTLLVLLCPWALYRSARTTAAALRKSLGAARVRLDEAGLFLATSQGETTWSMAALLPPVRRDGIVAIPLKPTTGRRPRQFILVPERALADVPGFTDAIARRVAAAGATSAGAPVPA